MLRDTPLCIVSHSNLLGVREVDFWDLREAANPQDHRAHAEQTIHTLLRNWDANATTSSDRPTILINRRTDFLHPSAPIEWLGDLLETLAGSMGCDFILFTAKPEQWQQRLQRLAAATRARGAWLASEWLDGRLPLPRWAVALVSTSTEANDPLIGVLQAIPASLHVVLWPAAKLSVSVTDPRLFAKKP